MALTTRVWGAGKLLLLGGALLLTYLLFAAASMRLALKTREVIVPALTGQTVNDASGAAGRAGLTLKVEEGTADRSEGARRTDPDPGARSRRAHAAAAQRQGVDQRRTALDRWCRRSSASPSGRRSCACSRTAWSCATIAEIRSADYPAGIGRRADAAAAERERTCRAAREPRRARHHLRDAGSDRRQRRSRRRPAARQGFRVAVVGDHPYPGVPGRHRPAPAPEGGFQIAPGEPISLEVSR